MATGNALSPTATYDSSDGNVYLVFASGAVWGTSTENTVETVNVAISGEN